MREAGKEEWEASSFLLGSSAFGRKSFILPRRVRQVFWEVRGSSPRERLDAQQQVRAKEAAQTAREQAAGSDALSSPVSEADGEQRPYPRGSGLDGGTAPLGEGTWAGGSSEVGTVQENKVRQCQGALTPKAQVKSSWTQQRSDQSESSLCAPAL